ncbi:hypothetical protein KA517_01605 [Candidatus Gracilibacteria bacterium]|nr:hypothetical protein [Candidatus Gracilibacteria bacterium]
MKWKAFLLMLGLFIGTPILFGQTGPTDVLPNPAQLQQSGTAALPTVPALPNANQLQQSAALPTAPALPTTPPLSADSLRAAGVNPSSLNTTQASSALSGAQSQASGLLQPLPTVPALPTPGDVAGLAKSFAEKTFPEEFAAAKGGLQLPEGVPSGLPTGVPSGLPTGVPSGLPTGVPSGLPTGVPSGLPTGVPSGLPTGVPSGLPTGVPSGLPTGVPSGLPTGVPSSIPTTLPTSN